MTMSTAEWEAAEGKRPDQPPPELIYRHRVHLSKALRELRQHKELVLTLAERELRARYKQTNLGFTWSLIVPLFLVIVFTLFIDRVAEIDTEGAPYALFAYLGLIPWTFFSVSVNHGGQSLINNSTLITKVRCPREVFPMTSVGLSAFDSVISTGMLGLLFLVFGVAPKSTSYMAVPLLLVQVAFTLGVTLLISSITVYVRDVRQAMPLLLQLGLFATPVAYPVPLSPFFEKLYALVNPLAPVIEGYRSVILYGESPRWDLVGLGAITAFTILFVGYYVFKRLEAGFADVA